MHSDRLCSRNPGPLNEACSKPSLLNSDLMMMLVAVVMVVVVVAVAVAVVMKKMMKG